MKNKSIIGALAILLSLTVVTSCEDMLDIDSSRVVYEDKHDLGSNADSVYSTLGLLHSLQQIADRYVLLGEVRGDFHYHRLAKEIFFIISGCVKCLSTKVLISPVTGCFIFTSTG